MIHDVCNSTSFMLTLCLIPFIWQLLYNYNKTTNQQKIDEPDTPYTHYEHHSDDESTSSARQPRSPDETQPHHEKNSLASQWGDISSKLQAVADKRDAFPLSPALSRDSNMSGDDEELEEEDEVERKKKFKDMRKKHYNEAEMMRKWREAHANMDDEEDEDEEEEDVKMKE